MNAAVKLPETAVSESLPALVLARARAEPQRAIVRQKRLGVWRPTTGEDLVRAVEACAAGLAAFGLEPGQTAGVLAAPGPEWLVADLAIQSLGAVSAGFHAETAPGELLAFMRACAPRVLIVDTMAALDVALDLKEAVADIRLVVCVDAAAAAEIGDDDVVSFDALQAKGAASANRSAAPWETCDPDAVAAIIPTSGASAPSRGARLTHRALRAAVDAGMSLVELREGDERLSLMPASHVFERVFGLYTCLAAGVVVNFPEGADTVFDNLRELQPQIISGPPALWSRIDASLTLASAEATPFQRKLFETARASRGGLGDFVVLRKVRRDFGLSRARVALSSGGPLLRSVRDRFEGLGVHIDDVYALAEAGGAVAIVRETPRHFALARGAEAEIGGDGRLRLRTASAFSGYVGDAASPGEWLVSGDDAERRDGGFILSGSADAKAWDVEEELAASPYVAASIVSGEARDALSALVLIDYDHVVRYAQSRSTPFTHFKSLAEAQDVRDLIEREIARANAAIAPARIVAFKIADRQIDSGAPELGPAMELRRRIALRTLAGDRQ